MGLGEKLFEESGKVTSFKITKVHPVEGTTIEVSATIDLKGVGRFPSGKEMASGIMVQYPHGVVDGTFQGNLMTANGEQIFWWAHEKSRVGQDGKIKGLAILSMFTNSQTLNWVNRIVAALETEFSPETMQFKSVAYEWT